MLRESTGSSQRTVTCTRHRSDPFCPKVWICLGPSGGRRAWSWMIIRASAHCPLITCPSPPSGSPAISFNVAASLKFAFYRATQYSVFLCVGSNAITCVPNAGQKHWPQEKKEGPQPWNESIYSAMLQNSLSSGQKAAPWRRGLTITIRAQISAHRQECCPYRLKVQESFSAWGIR